MTVRLRQSFAALAAIVAFSTPALAQRTGVMGELMKDVKDVQGKLVALAKAMPADKSSWRPGAGVRSVNEVFLHVAADNYFMPTIVGVSADPATKITATDFNALTAFEKQNLSQDATVAALDKSFAHLLKAMADSPEAKMDEKMKFFGQESTTRGLWIATTTHLHEHLGQAIAYARMNGVVPPWSK